MAHETLLDRRAVSFGGIALALSACAPKPRRLARLRIGYQKSGVLLSAKSRGLIEKALPGTSLEWALFPSGPPMLEAMAAGAVDFGATGDTPPIFAQAAGAPLVYVASQPLTGQGEAVIMPPGSSLASPKDLKGRRVAVTRGSSSHLLLIRALNSVGLKLSDIKVVFLSPGDAAGAFGSGAIDAWAIWDPFLALAMRDQKARILVSGVALPASDAFYVASARLAQEAPDVLRDFLDALRSECVWGNSHHAEMVQIIAGASRLPPDVVLTSLRRGPLAVEPMTAPAIARQQAAADIFAGLHIIPRSVEVGRAVWREWRPKA